MQSYWTNRRVAGNLKRHAAHWCNVTIMIYRYSECGNIMFIVRNRFVGIYSQPPKWRPSCPGRDELTHPHPLGRRHLFPMHILNENDRIPIQISLNFVPRSPIYNKPALVRVMAWHRIGDEPLSEPMLTWFIDAYMWLCGIRGDELLISNLKLPCRTVNSNLFGCAVLITTI